VAWRAARCISIFARFSVWRILPANEGLSVKGLKMRFLILFLVLMAAPAYAIEKCGSGKRVTCVVDGDTFWQDGVKIRMEGYDTPEPQTGICGGVRERQLAARATSRLP
jgi:endonuclease YncB( thermonuclease family)